MRRGLLGFGAGLVLALAGCPRREPPPPPPDAGGALEPCASYLPLPTRVGSVPAALRELSGLVASARHPGIYWSHNDSGNALEAFAIRETGEIVARFPVEGVVALDVEDVALGPCGARPDRTCLFLADFGDNQRKRAWVQLIEVDEPAALEPVALEGRALAFRYPGGPRDAEALVIDLLSGVPHVVSKTGEHLGDVYRLDGLGPDAKPEAVHLGTIFAATGSDRLTTGADVHPDGDRLLLRTYSRVWELRGTGRSSVEALLGGRMRELPSAPQPQSEAVAYARDGSGYLLGTEGTGEGLFRVHCRP